MRSKVFKKKSWSFTVVGGFVFYVLSSAQSQDFSWSWTGNWEPRLEISVDTLYGYENHYSLHFVLEGRLPEEGDRAIFVAKSGEGDLSIRIFPEDKVYLETNFVTLSTKDIEMIAAQKEELIQSFQKLGAKDQLTRDEEGKFMDLVFSSIPELDVFQKDYGEMKRSNYPFAGTITVPAKIESCVLSGDDCVLKGTMHDVDFGEMDQKREFSGIWTDHMSFREDAGIGFSLSLPRKLGEHLKKRRIDVPEDQIQDTAETSVFHGPWWNILIDSSTKQIVAIEMGEIVAGGRIVYDYKLDFKNPQWESEDDFKIVEVEGFWQLSRAPEETMVEVVVGGIPLEFEKNETAVWKSRGDNAMMARASLDAYLFWYTPNGIVGYATKVEGTPAATDPVPSTLTRSVVVSELFDGWETNRGDDFEILSETKKIEAQFGFDLFSTASLDAEVIKSELGPITVNVKGYLDVQNERYFVSDWSVERYTENGTKPNYMLFRKQ